MLIFQALANSRFFRHDCGVNISCKPHVLQTDLFLKIYSSIWLSQNFLGYNSIILSLQIYWNKDCYLKLRFLLKIASYFLFILFFVYIYIFILILQERVNVEAAITKDGLKFHYATHLNAIFFFHGGSEL
jgi:hypothetical protein